MKPMMAPAKTFEDLQHDVRVAVAAYCDASKHGYKGLRAMNNIERVETRIGHMWAQYLNAVKLRDAAFDALMSRG